MAKEQSAVGVARNGDSVSGVVRSAFAGDNLQNFTPDESGIILQLWAYRRGDTPIVNEAQLVQELIQSGLIDEGRAAKATGELKRMGVIWPKISRGQGTIINYLEMRGSVEREAASRFAGAENARGEQAPSNGGASGYGVSIESIKAAFINGDSTKSMAAALDRSAMSVNNYLHRLGVYGRYPKDGAVRAKILSDFERGLVAADATAKGATPKPDRRPNWMAVERLLDAVVKHGPDTHGIAGEMGITERGALGRLSRFGIERVIDIPIDTRAREELARKVLVELERKEGVRGVMRDEFLVAFVQNGTATEMGRALGTTPNIVIDCARALRIENTPPKAEREAVANEIRQRHGAGLAQWTPRAMDIEPALAPIAQQTGGAGLKNVKTTASYTQAQEGAPHDDKKVKQMTSKRQKGISAEVILDAFVAHGSYPDMAAEVGCTPENIYSRLPKLLGVEPKRVTELLHGTGTDDKRALADAALDRMEASQAPLEAKKPDIKKVGRPRLAQSKVPPQPTSQNNSDGAGVLAVPGTGMHALEEFGSAFGNLDSQFGRVAESAKLLRGPSLGRILDLHRKELKADVESELSSMARDAARELADREIAEAAKHAAAAMKYAPKGYVNRSLLRGIIAEVEREEMRNRPRSRSTAQ